MPKSIKKSYKYLIVFASVVIMLSTGLVLFLSNSKVQTYVIQKIVGRISKTYSAAITVGKIKFTLFNKFNINDLLLLDQNQDTLIYASEVTIGIRKLDLKNNTISLGKIALNSPVIKLATDSSGVMNLTIFLEKLKKPADTTKTIKYLFSVSQLDINDGRFIFRDERGKESKTRIDFSNIRLSGINTQVENIVVGKDSVTLDIYSLVCAERSGFRVKSLSSQVNFSDKRVYLSSFNLNLDSSVINAEHVGLLPKTPGSYSDFLSNVKLDISLNRSLMNTSDLEYFIPVLDSINEQFFFSGDISGTIAELRGRNITMNYNENTFLSCDFDFSGLPDIQNTYIYIGVSNFITNTTDIEKIKISGNKKIVIPPTLRNLGNISFKGNFTGFLTDFVTYGDIRTKKGNVSTDISFRPDKDNSFTYQGLIKGSYIDLGEITGQPDHFGDISIEANINGSSTSFKHFAASLTGKIDSVEINNYKYRNIALNGSFTEKIWDGSFKINEKNIKLDLQGRFDFSSKLPVFDFTMNLPKAYLHNLNIAPSDTSAFLSMILTANFTGNSIDNLAGDIKLVNTRYRKQSNNLDFRDFTIRAFTENYLPKIELRTDFVDADLRGYYNFAGIAGSVRTALAALMPNEFTNPGVNIYSQKNNFKFNVNFKNTDNLNKILNTGILLAEDSNINGGFYPDSAIYVNVKSPALSIKNFLFSDLLFDANIKDSILVANLNTSSLLLAGKTELKEFNVMVSTTPDNIKFTSDWDNKEKDVNKGSLEAEGVFSKNIFGKPILKVDVKPTEIAVNNDIWNISPSVITIDTSAIQIDKLYVKNLENYFLIDGSVSENSSDTLKLYFNGIDLGPLNNIRLSENAPNPENIKLLLKGVLNGTVSLTNVYKNIMFESNIHINGFSILGSKYGDVEIKSQWDNVKKIVRVSASNDLEGVKMFDLSGFYDPAAKNFKMTANAKKLPVEFLNPLLKSFASEIKGFATGTVKLEGKFSQPVLTGALWAEEVSAKIDYLQTKYRFTDSVRFDKTGIKFNNITAYDEKNNTIKVNGIVGHRYLKTYTVDLTLTPNNCMVLNTVPKDNDLFYGVAYGSGVVTIKGADGNLAFDVSASTGKNTKFYIPLTSGLSVSASSFISFIDSTNLRKARDGSRINTSASQVKETFELNIDLDVTPEAEVQLIFDSKIGDIMKGYGQSSGPLNISMAKNGDFRVYGDYVIEEGDYLFTLGNIFNKKFSVKNGGTISFNGDMDNAELNIEAIYALKASLYDLFQDEQFRGDRIDVECHLFLTGKLFNPVIGMDIILPKSDEITVQYLKNAITTEEELSRQFVYLLVMNSFYADPASGTTVNTATSGTAAMAVTTTEMLSNQLSNWLSQISNDFDIGFNYRPGNELSTQEVEFALSTQLLNDRVAINGNLDVRGNQNTNTTTSNIAGAFDVEVKITEKIRFKVFNRSNDNIILDTKSNYTQGLGLFFRQDFDKFRDLFKKRNKGEMKKEENKTVVTDN